MFNFIKNNIHLLLYNRIHRTSLNPDQLFIGQQFFNSSFGLWIPAATLSECNFRVFGIIELPIITDMPVCRPALFLPDHTDVPLCRPAVFLRFLSALRAAYLPVWLLAVRLKMQTDRFRSFKIQFRQSLQFRPPLLTRNSSQKAGKLLGEVIKDVPLYLNSISTLFIQKRRK